MDAEAMEQPCGCQAGGRAGGPVGPQGWNRDNDERCEIQFQCDFQCDEQFLYTFNFKIARSKKHKRTIQNLNYVNFNLNTTTVKTQYKFNFNLFCL